MPGFKFKANLGYLLGIAASKEAIPYVRDAYSGRLNEIHQQSSRRHASLAPDVNLVLMAARSGGANAGQIADSLTAQGVSPEIAGALYGSTRNVPAPSDLVRLFFRGEISFQELESILRVDGYWGEDVSLMVKAAEYFPSVQDLITFAVREVFSPEIAERYGQFEDFPQAFADQARKAGLSESWAKAYWAAHWRLPSFRDGVDLYHRGIISHDDMIRLARALDIMPYWREKLLKGMETLPTRVDIRRMYQVGTIDEEEVFVFYRKLGYSEENARKLTDFTVKVYGQDEDEAKQKARQETMSAILQGLRYRLLESAEAVQKLQEIGYSEQAAEYLVKLEETKLALKTHISTKLKNRHLTKTVVKNGFLSGLVSPQDALDELVSLGYSDDDADYLLKLWERQYRQKLTADNVRKIKKLYLLGKMSYGEVADELNRLGLSRFVIDSLLVDFQSEERLQHYENRLGYNE